MKSESSLKTSLNKTILVLGAGYLGKKISDFLESKNHTVLLLASDKVNYHNKKTFWRILLNNEPDVVINCSGFTGRPNIDEAENKKGECWNLNVKSPLQVAHLCSTFRVKHIHISSGCIYTGYDKDYTELDSPNFGLWDESSTYSKTKHAFEFLSQEYPSKILRIRMPISGDNDRCYLSKICGYDNLIDYKNSKTYIPDLCEFVYRLIEDNTLEWKDQDIYNIVNPEPLYTSQVTSLLSETGIENPNWKFVNIGEIPIKAPRSNCVLDNAKASAIMKFRSEAAILREVLGLQTESDLIDSEK